MTNIFVPKLFGFAFSGPPLSVGETLHVAYKKFFFLLFLVNTKYISSRELKTSELSLVLRTCENSYIFNTLDEIYLALI